MGAAAWAMMTLRNASRRRSGRPGRRRAKRKKEDAKKEEPQRKNSRRKNPQKEDVKKEEAQNPKPYAIGNPRNRPPKPAAGSNPSAAPASPMTETGDAPKKPTHELRRGRILEMKTRTGQPPPALGGTTDRPSRNLVSFPVHRGRCRSDGLT